MTKIQKEMEFMHVLCEYVQLKYWKRLTIR